MRKPSTGSPLVPLYELTGEHFYYIGFGLLVIAMNAVMYLPFAFLDISNWKYKKRFNN